MSNAGLNILATHSIEEIGRERWSTFGAEKPFASYDWHRYGERAMSGCTPLYICASSHGQPAARASFWLTRDEPLLPSSQPGDRVVRAALRSLLRARPLLICRSPLADTSGLILHDTLHRRAALGAVLETAEAYGRKAKASFILFDYLTPELEMWEDWPGSLRKVCLNEPGTCLPIAWNSYESYLAGFSRSVWKDYRRHKNQADRMGISVRAESQVSNLEEALPLIHGVEGRHGSIPRPWTRGMLENASMIPSTWISAWSGGRLVGCGLLLADGGVQLATLLGLDYTCSYVYFQLMYMAVRQAIESGAQALRAGSGAYQLKSRLGFQLEANNTLRFEGMGRSLSLIGRFAAG